MEEKEREAIDAIRAALTATRHAAVLAQAAGFGTMLQLWLQEAGDQLEYAIKECGF